MDGQRSATATGSRGLYRVQKSHGFTAAGTFLHAQAPSHVVFSWGFADGETAQHVKHKPTESIAGGTMPAGGTRVSVTRDAEDRGTRLTLRYDDLPNTELPDARRVAWRASLRRLAIRAVGGDRSLDPHSSA